MKETENTKEMLEKAMKWATKYTENIANLQKMLNDHKCTVEQLEEYVSKQKELDEESETKIELAEQLIKFAKDNSLSGYDPISTFYDSVAEVKYTQSLRSNKISNVTIVVSTGNPRIEISAGEVIVRGEDCPPYVDNFAKVEGWLNEEHQVRNGWYHPLCFILEDIEEDLKARGCD